MVHADGVHFLSPKRPQQSIRYKNARLSVEKRPLSLLPYGHLRLEMLYAGICGTDLHLMKRDAEGFVATSAPLHIPAEGRVLGHEGVGRVLSMGTGVDRFKQGDIVALESIITCQSCEPCRRGQVIAGVRPSGRIALLGRNGKPLRLDGVDHIITNGITIRGVRGHLGGAFGRLIALYQSGRLPLDDAVTTVITSLDMLEEQLTHHEQLISQNCKVLVKLSSYNQ